MQEIFLHFIWQNRLFEEYNLKTVNDDSVEIIDLGKHNFDAGPDFIAAKIKINDIIWVGNVEIHINAKDWDAHKHNLDPAYNNVILHVVFSNEKIHFTHNKIPLNCLLMTFPDDIYQHYENMLSDIKWIACADDINTVDRFYLSIFLQRILIERIHFKIKMIQNLFLFNNNSWEQTLYQLIARYFGLKINAQPFEQLARSVPLEIIAKQKNSLIQIEAILFGQAGFLSDSTCYDEYFLLLKAEYKFLRNKYKLNPMDVSIWKFLRLRPVNFPTLRIAQLAALLFSSNYLFSSLINKDPLSVKKQILRVKASEYWDTHYLFGKKSEFKNKIIGSTMVDIIIINAIVPMMFFYGKKIDDNSFSIHALDILNKMPAEKNYQIKKWNETGVMPCNAADTQALLQLKQNYCDKYRCLNCEIAHQILINKWKQNN